MKKRHLTTNQGVPITDNQNSLTVGERHECIEPLSKHTGHGDAKYKKKTKD